MIYMPTPLAGRSLSQMFSLWKSMREDPVDGKGRDATGNERCLRVKVLYSWVKAP